MPFDHTAPCQGWACRRAGHVTIRTETEGPPLVCDAPRVNDRHETCGDTDFHEIPLKPPRRTT